MRKLSILLAVASAALAMSSPVLAQALPTPTPDEVCEDGMGFLRTVSRDQIEAVDPGYKVAIWPVCPGQPNPGLRVAGNAASLHGAISQNDVLVEALEEEDYVPDDVVGIRFGGGPSIILYVHRAN